MKAGVRENCINFPLIYAADGTERRRARGEQEAVKESERLLMKRRQRAGIIFRVMISPLQEIIIIH